MTSVRRNSHTSKWSLPSFISSHATSQWKRLKRAVSGRTILTIRVGVWPQAAGGVPFNACEFQSKGDPITDLFENLAAEQKARSTYDNILRVVRDIPEIADPIKFLRAREIVHFQRFGEALRSIQEELDAKNFYAFNPSFDNPCKASCKS